MTKKLLGVMALLLALVVLAGCGGGSAPANKPAYPERPIEGIVGWGAGGGTDVFARAIAKSAGEMLGQPIAVKNMPGSSGAIAGDYVTQQPPDGYTLWFMGSNYAVNVALGRTPHRLDQYIPIARIQHDTAMLQVTKTSKFKTIEDIVAFAKQNPGKLKVGGTGAASFDEVVIALWEEAAGIKVNYVPYENGGQMQAALLGGHLDVMFEELGPVAGRVADGSLVPVLAFSDKKIAKFPDLAVAPDKGWNITLGNWRGVMVKKGTDPAIVKKLEEAFTKAKGSPSYLKVEKDTYLDLRPGYLNGKDYAAAIQKDIDVYKAALTKLGYVK
jgi:putative tricarboxylic transport membrane protein